VAQLVDYEVLVGHRVLQQDQMPRRVAAKASEARYAEQPRRDDDANAAHIHRLGIELEPVEACLRAFEQLAAIQRGDRRSAWFLEDEDDEQDQNEDRCADADVHVLPLVAYGRCYPQRGSPKHLVVAVEVADHVRADHVVDVELEKQPPPACR
jgi:hypothetical protein